jgi:hypothetical protein
MSDPMKQGPRSSRRAFSLGVFAVLLAIPRRAHAGTYLDRAALLLGAAVGETAYLRTRLSDRELAQVVHAMSVARRQAASAMTVPKEVAQAHPHLLLTLENYEQATEGATRGEGERFIIYAQRALDEERTFRAVLKQFGWTLPSGARNSNQR